MMGKRNSLSRSKHRHCGDSTSSSEEAATQKPIMNRQLDHDDFDAVNLKKPKREAFPIDDHEVDAKDEDSESKYEIHKQVKQQNKDELHSSRRPQVESLPEVDDGKCPITCEFEKYRRHARIFKNPRKKHKVYDIFKMPCREGQVRKVKKPVGSYGGEATRINPGISRHIRFKRQLDHDNFDAINSKKPKREAFPIDDHEVDAKDEDSESKYEIHKQVKQQNKDELHSSRRPQVESLPEVDDGKCPVTCEFEKYRRLARLLKNPRKKHKVYDIFKMPCREGQVPKVKNPVGSYGGEATRINPGISRHIRVKRQLDHDNFDAVNPKKPKREAFPIDDHEVDAKDEDSESKYEIHKQVKQQNKDELRSSRRPQVESLPEVDDGKRPITYEMEKNRGLTCRHKKLSKNPRKKDKVYHIYKMDRREGRVQKVKKPMGSYGGEATGINP